MGSKSTKDCFQMDILFDFITVCKPEREIDATTRKATSDQKLWLERRGGSWKHTFVMPCLPSLVSQLPFFLFLETCLQHSPTNPLVLWGDVNITVCQDLGWCYQVGGEPGSGSLDIVETLAVHNLMCLRTWMSSLQMKGFPWPSYLFQEWIPWGSFSDNSLWCCWGMGYQEAGNVLEVWASKGSGEFT